MAHRKRRGTDGNNAKRGPGKSNRGRTRVLGDPYTGEPREMEITMIRNAAACGIKWADLFMLFGCSRETFARWIKEYPDIKREYDHGITRVGFEVGAALVMRAKQGDLPSIRYFERTRRQIYDDHAPIEVEVSHTVAAPPSLTADEWQKLYGPEGSEVLVIENPPQEELARE